MTTWTNLQRDEERLKTGLHVLQLLRSLEGMPAPREDSIDEGAIADVFAGLTADPPPPALVEALVVAERLKGTLPDLKSLIKELDEALYYENCLLAAER